MAEPLEHLVQPRVQLVRRRHHFRGAIGHYLAHLGARDAAALFTSVGATGA